MADTEAGGSGVAATTEAKDDRPQKVFPKKSEPEYQNIMWDRLAPDVCKTQGTLSQQLSVVTKWLEGLRWWKSNLLG